MTPTSPTPQLPKWIFFLTDAVLLLTAWFIAYRSPGPLSSTAVFAITACVIVGAILGTIPLVIHYEREKNEALDDRQRALEALATTVAASAEQISIAAAGLQAMADLAQKNLRLAELLPAKFQEKISEFESLLTNAQTEEREELKKELARLRASESERLEAIAAKVDHAAREFAKLESSALKHLADAQAALATAPEALTAATTAALAQLDAKIAATVTSRPPMTVSSAADEPVRLVPPAVELTAPPFGGHLISLAPAPLATPAAPASATVEVPPGGAQEGSGETMPVRKRAPRKPKPEPAAKSTSTLPLGETPAAPSGEFDQSEPSDLSAQALALAEASAKEGAEVGENVISSDRATRLLVTAYIGIGNRLFIRGDGPGLSWDKGVPLSFVSIGKWRWETSEATAPVKFKLFKNDETECAALGGQSLSPEHQLEITATF